MGVPGLPGSVEDSAMGISTSPLVWGDPIPNVPDGASAGLCAVAGGPSCCESPPGPGACGTVGSAAADSCCAAAAAC